MRPIELTMRVPPDDRSVRLGRRFLAHALLLLGQDDLEPTASLLTSELLGNAVRYATDEVHLSVRAVRGGVRVVVSDDGPGEPRRAAEDPGPDMPRGRGLQVVDRLADRWNVEMGEGVKSVWFEVLAPAGVGHLPARAH